MGLKYWYTNTKTEIKDFGIYGGLKSSAKSFTRGLKARATWAIYPDINETNVLDYTWDGLIILDTCRPDYLEMVADEYEFIPEHVPRIYSNASWSQQWYQRTFTESYADTVSDIGLITSNPFADGFTDDRYDIQKTDFYHFKQIYDEDTGQVKPSIMTDQTLNEIREHDIDKFITHYMQPHEPYRKLDKTKSGNYSLWPRIYSGEINPEEARMIYLDNIRWVLDEIADLIENVSGNIVITADHAELLGEYGMWGHPRKCHIPKLRTVPWIQINAGDTKKTRKTENIDPIERNHLDREEMLSALGYK